MDLPISDSDFSILSILSGTNTPDGSLTSLKFRSIELHEAHFELCWAGKWGLNRSQARSHSRNSASSFEVPIPRQLRWQEDVIGNGKQFRGSSHPRLFVCPTVPYSALLRCFRLNEGLLETKAKRQDTVQSE